MPEAAVAHAKAAAMSVRPLRMYKDSMLPSLTDIRRPLLNAIAGRLLVLLNVHVPALQRGQAEKLPDWWDNRVPFIPPAQMHESVLNFLFNMLLRQVHRVYDPEPRTSWALTASMQFDRAMSCLAMQAASLRMHIRTPCVHAGSAMCMCEERQSL